MPPTFLLVALILLGALIAPIWLLVLVIATSIGRMRRYAVHGLKWGGGAATLAMVVDLVLSAVWHDPATLSGVAMGAGGAFTGTSLAALAVRWWRRREFREPLTNESLQVTRPRTLSTQAARQLKTADSHLSLHGRATGHL